MARIPMNPPCDFFAALGRVLVFDVWQLERIPRVLSFMALGIVLVVLGFIYNDMFNRTVCLKT